MIFSKSLICNSNYESLKKYTISLPSLSEKSNRNHRVITTLVANTNIYRIKVAYRIKFKKSAIRLGRRRKVFISAPHEFVGTYSSYHLDGRMDYVGGKPYWHTRFFSSKKLKGLRV